MIIYKATNKINGKVYIGKTIYSLNKRMSVHVCSKVGYFSHALRKYGLQSFDISIIDAAQSEEILNEKEIYWIKTFNCRAPNGYNLTDGGEGTSGRIVSEETKKRMVAGMTAEGRVRMGAASRNRIYTHKMRENLSNAAKKRCESILPPSQKGRKRSEETKEKLRGKRNALGTHPSEETRRKIALAKIGNKNALGHKQTDEEKKKKSIAMKGRVLTVEHKKRLSEAARVRILKYPMPWGMYENKPETINSAQQ